MSNPFNPFQTRSVLRFPPKAPEYVFQKSRGRIFCYLANIYMLDARAARTLNAGDPVEKYCGFALSILYKSVERYHKKTINSQKSYFATYRSSDPLMANYRV